MPNEDLHIIICDVKSKFLHVLSFTACKTQKVTGKKESYRKWNKNVIEPSFTQETTFQPLDA